MLALCVSRLSLACTELAKIDLNWIKWRIHSFFLSLFSLSLSLCLHNFLQQLLSLARRHLFLCARRPSQSARTQAAAAATVKLMAVMRSSSVRHNNNNNKRDDSARAHSPLELIIISSSSSRKKRSEKLDASGAKSCALLSRRPN